MAVEISFRTVLREEEVAAFAAKGYHIHDVLFSQEEVARVREACVAVSHGTYETGSPPDHVGWRPGDDPLAVIKLDNCWKANAAIRAMVTSSRLGHVAAQLIGAPEIRLWHDQYLYKPPQGGKVVTWHQDWAYWQMIAESKTVTCWIALGDVLSIDQGPMMYLEGSHHLGLYPLPEVISGDDEMKPSLPDGKPMREAPVLVRAGQVAFHHGLTLHGSGKNLSDAPRYAIVSHVMSGECTYKPGQHHMNEDEMKKHTGYPAPGERFRGGQFPVLWPSASEEGIS